MVLGLLYKKKKIQKKNGGYSMIMLCGLLWLWQLRWEEGIENYELDFSMIKGFLWSDMRST